MRKPAVFLDSDGILCEPGDPGPEVEEPRLVRDSLPFVRELNRRGYLVLVITHEPSLARGERDSIQVHRIHRKLRARIADGGGRIDDLLFCPHDPVAAGPTARPELAISCRCRRPAPGLILRAAQLHDVDLPRSIMVCHNLADLHCGRSAAVETVLVTPPGDVRPASPRPNHIANGLLDVLRLIEVPSETVGRR